MVACKDYNFYNFRSELILKLVEDGFDVTLVCPSGDKVKYSTDRGCHFIGHTMDRRGTNPLKDMKLIYMYYKIFRKGRPDVVLSYTTKSVLYSGIACRMLHIPYIVNNAGLLEPSNYNPIVGICLTLLYKLGFSNASCMMYQNSRERDVLNNILHNKIRYRDIPGSGVNLNEFRYTNYPNEENPITFNYVGRLVNIKGINEFLKCAESIKSKYPNTRFLIYGDYDDEIYRNRVNELQKRGIIEYAGVKMDMRPCIKAAHAVIHASYYEGMTNVVLEHSAMGRVCIGSDIPGIREEIEDGKTGYLFKVKNTEELIYLVERFIHLPYGEKVGMGKAARRKMEREFDRRIVTNIYLEEINRILE